MVERASEKMLKYSSEDVEKGVVTFFDARPEKRFGFMLDASGGKVFFHYNNGGNHGSRTRSRMPMKDDEIHFIRSDFDDRGPKARLWAFDHFDVVYDLRIKGWLKEGERRPQSDGHALRALVNAEPIELISSGRYLYHLQDIAEIKAKPTPLNPIDKMNLQRMETEVAEYEAAHPDDEQVKSRKQQLVTQ